MYIQPQGAIDLYYGYPGDKEYNNVPYFANKTAQKNYFDNLAHMSVSQMSYTRKDNNVIRCTVVGDRSFVESVNYVRFINTGFSNDYVYAFVDSVEYVNNGRYDIVFSIDEMQTYFFGRLSLGGLKQCYIERETQATDAIGDNLEPEPVNIGEYIFNTFGKVQSASWDFTDLSIIIAVVDVEASGGGVHGKNYDGIYGGATLYGFKLSDTSGINAFLEDYVDSNKADAILLIYTIPSQFVTFDSSNHLVPEGNALSQTITNFGGAITTDDTIDGYKPKNKKLYTYPYNYMHVDDGNGGELTLKYEYFEDLTPRGYMYATLTSPVQIMLRVTGYKGVKFSEEAANPDSTNSLVISNFPLCSWNNDSFSAWLAQNANPAALLSNLGSAIAQGATVGTAGGVTGAAVGAAVGAASTALGLGTGAYIAQKLTADTIHGSYANGSVATANRLNAFYRGRMSINNQQARIIDDYFSMYGYACGKVKVPNIHVRPHWTYTKTRGCTIIPNTATGAVPAEDVKKIEDIFDHGVRFWNDPAEIGNYDLDNSPT